MQLIAEIEIRKFLTQALILAQRITRLLSYHYRLTLQSVMLIDLLVDNISSLFIDNLYVLSRQDCEIY